MSLAKLFYLKETFRTRVREWRQACFRQRASRRHGQPASPTQPASTTLRGVRGEHSVLSPQSLALGGSQLSFAISYQQARTAQPPATSPVIDWGEEESKKTTPVALGGVKLKSSWLSKFLSATGAKQDRATAHDFEVALPKKK